MHVTSTMVMQHNKCVNCQWKLLYGECFEDERGFDLGGVSRDMYSAFWEKAFQQLFDGSLLLAPAMHAGIDFTMP